MCLRLATKLRVNGGGHGALFEVRLRYSTHAGVYACEAGVRWAGLPAVPAARDGDFDRIEPFAVQLERLAMIERKLDLAGRTVRTS